MLDLKLIRENPDTYKAKIESKLEDPKKIDQILELDVRRRTLIGEVETLKATRNTVTNDIAQKKKNKENADSLIAEMKTVSDRIKELDTELSEAENKINEILLYTPNIPHDSVPVGKSAADNVEVRRWETGTFTKEFKPLDHIELGKKCGILDFERGAKISGSGFPVYVGKGAALERALINFFLDTHTANHGYKEIFPPFVVNEESMKGTGQLPKFAEDMYTIQADGLYLIPTAEVPITNLHRNETFKAEELTVKYCGYSACFRREAGSYGKDTKGFLRVHQFNKVELVKFANPVGSYTELENMVNDVENILKALKVPYRILLLCTGDLSFNAAKCYDIEVWSPAENKYLEASSCSNFQDFQARRANIRFKPDANSKPEYVHTLNGSGLATSRLMVSLLENNQNADGSITIPEVLRHYTRFDVIEPA